jgi:hypothetical protein
LLKQIIRIVEVTSQRKDITVQSRLDLLKTRAKFQSGFIGHEKLGQQAI